MARCTGETVVVESPTIPTFTDESGAQSAFVKEAGALTISIGDISLCACGELVAVTLVLYDGNFFYDGTPIYSATLSA